MQCFCVPDHFRLVIIRGVDLRPLLGPLISLRLLRLLHAPRYLDLLEHSVLIIVLRYFRAFGLVPLKHLVQLSLSPDL